MCVCVGGRDLRLLLLLLNVFVLFPSFLLRGAGRSLGGCTGVTRS